MLVSPSKPAGRMARTFVSTSRSPCGCSSRAGCSSGHKSGRGATCKGGPFSFLATCDPLVRDEGVPHNREAPFQRSNRGPINSASLHEGHSMAKKAKRRGRPPGSKNKKSLGKALTTMDVAQLRAHIEDLQKTLAKKVSEQRAYFERQLAQLSEPGGDGSAVGNGRRRQGPIIIGGGRPLSGKRAKAKAKYQSKKNKSLRWSGRGMTPVWMREEMKGTKLKKEDFAIK